MIDRIQEFIERLQLDTSRASLAVWVAIINVAIVILVVIGISISAIGSLRELADQQGKARVQLAGATAREDIRRFSEDALTQARTVADRQTFQRLLAENNPATIGPYLRRSCNNEVIAACALIQEGGVGAQAGVQLAWNEIATAESEQGERFMATPTGTRYAILGASTHVAGTPSRRLLVVRLLDERAEELLTEHVALPIRLINYRAFVERRETDDFTRLHSAGLSDGRSAVLRIKNPDLYAASFPVFSATGEAIVLLEARLASTEIVATVSEHVKRLLITAIILA